MRSGKKEIQEEVTLSKVIPEMNQNLEQFKARRIQNVAYDQNKIALENLSFSALIFTHTPLLKTCTTSRLRRESDWSVTKLHESHTAVARHLLYGNQAMKDYYYYQLESYSDFLSHILLYQSYL